MKTKMIFAACSIVLLLLVAVSYAQAQTGSNLQGTLLSSAVRTATTVTSADQSNFQWKGGWLMFNVSSYVTGTYVPTLQGKDPVSGNYYTVATGSAINATGLTQLRVYPGIAVTATSANSLIPRTWRLSLAATATPVTMTISVGTFLSE
jgi:hypothetical protein